MNPATVVKAGGRRSRSSPRSSSGTGVVAARTTEVATPRVPLATMFQAAQSPSTGQRHPEHLDPLALPDQRQEHGEEQERQLDHEPPGQGRQRQPGHPGQDGQRHRVDPEGPERLARGGHDGQHEQHGGGQLALGPGSGGAGSSPEGRARGCGRPPRVSGARVGSEPLPGPDADRLPLTRSEQPAADPEGDQHADQAGEAGAEPLVADALDRVVGQGAVGEQRGPWRSPGSPCPRPPSPARRASWRRSR